jgi:hypothetical protein
MSTRSDSLPRQSSRLQVATAEALRADKAAISVKDKVRLAKARLKAARRQVKAAKEELKDARKLARKAVREAKHAKKVLRKLVQLGARNRSQKRSAPLPAAGVSPKARVTASRGLEGDSSD